MCVAVGEEVAPGVMSGQSDVAAALAPSVLAVACVVELKVGLGLACELGACEVTSVET